MSDLRLLTDEDVDKNIIRGIRRRIPYLDILRVQDVQLMGKPDAEILEFAANDNRIVVTHDVNTMHSAAVYRMNSGLSMPGVFFVHQQSNIVDIIDDLELICECSIQAEWCDRLEYIP